MKILLIDDNSDITGMFCELLTSEGHTVIEKNDGFQGYDEILQNDYDLIFLDIAIPEFSGFDILEKLENENKLTTNSIILFTATPISDDEIQKWIKKGLIDCLKKPIRLEKIINILKEIENKQK